MFDVNSPDVGTMTRAIDILTRYTNTKHRKPNFELESPAAESFGHCATCIDDITVPNWLLQWRNVSLPVLTVHGNHDNPHGEYSASPLDTLVSLGLIGHFGRITDTDRLKISPVTLTKEKALLYTTLISVYLIYFLYILVSFHQGGYNFEYLGIWQHQR